MSDDSCKPFLCKGSPFLLPQEICTQAVASFGRAKHPERIVAEFILSCVDAQKNLLLTKHMPFISQKFASTPENLDEYEAGITLPLQLVLGTIYYIANDYSRLDAQIAHISVDCCNDYFQFYEASLPKCYSMAYQKCPLSDVLLYARKYKSDLYYQVGTRVSQGIFFDTVRAIRIFQLSTKH